jgi:ABC-type multidrug transport system ATPase subunit
MDSLKSIVVARNVTIITTLHQPQTKIYQLLDRLVLFCNGQILYNGERSDVLSAFEAFGFRCPDNFNPADYLIDVISAKGFDPAPFVAKVDEQASMTKGDSIFTPTKFPKRKGTLFIYTKGNPIQSIIEQTTICVLALKDTYYLVQASPTSMQ